MNIHIKDKSLFEQLKENSIFNIEIGSGMYGTSDENSDKDLLFIYKPFLLERNSFSITHHQFQYKEDNTDYLFINIYTFIRNALNGDSTINFEIINSPLLKNTIFSYLYENRYDFYNYKIVRSYLGLARRDSQFVFKTNDDREQNKTISHIIRGFYFADRITKGDMNPIIEGELLQIINKVKTLTLNKDKKQILQEYMGYVSELREELNLNKFKLQNYMSIENQYKLDSFISSLDLINNNHGEKLMKLIYDVNENGIIY